jgi:D-glycero-alpha-D-manno-heptose 1-phosphate guanylyltransferase
MTFLADITPVILAGGLGTRLRAVLKDLPKPLAPVNGRPFLAYLFDQLLQAGFRQAVICTGYRGEQIEAAFGNAYQGLTLTYSRENPPLGTAGAVRLALPLASGKNLLIMNGDSYCGTDLAQFARCFHEGAYPAALLLAEVEDRARYGCVTLDNIGRVIAFLEKDGKHQPGLINAGILLLPRKIFEDLPQGKPISLEKELIPELIPSGLYGLVSRGTFIDIGIPESLMSAPVIFNNHAGSRKMPFAPKTGDKTC